MEAVATLEVTAVVHEVMSMRSRTTAGSGREPSPLSVPPMCCQIRKRGSEFQIRKRGSELHVAVVRATGGVELGSGLMRGKVRCSYRAQRV